MAHLHVRDLNDKLYESIKRRVNLGHRSISQEVVSMIESYLNRNDLVAEIQTLEFLKLSHSWQDTRNAKEIVSELRNSRTKNTRLNKINELLD